MNYVNQFLSKFKLRITRIPNNVNRNDLFLTKVGNKSPYAFFLNEDDKLYLNLTSIGFKFLFDENENVIAEFNNIKMYIQSFEDLYILNEIYYEGTYNFQLPFNFILIDIGMNVGFSSLFFAALNNVNKVFSYEPVPSTFQQGLKNFDLNPTLKIKIVPNNFGIGEETKKENFVYSKEWKGSVGIRGLEDFKKSNEKKSEIITVEIHDVAEIIYNAKSLGLPIVAKIDCEGAEYEIFDRLFKINEINSIDLFMIEWHDKGPENIIDIFKKCGFSTITSNPYVKNVGMIYAFKK